VGERVVAGWEELHHPPPGRGQDIRGEPFGLAPGRFFRADAELFREIPRPVDLLSRLDIKCHAQ